MDWIGHILEKSTPVIFTKDEYDILITGGYMARIVHETDLLGFYLVVEDVLEDMNEDAIELERDDPDRELILALIGKLNLLEGKTLFIP